MRDGMPPPGGHHVIERMMRRGKLGLAGIVKHARKERDGGGIINRAE